VRKIIITICVTASTILIRVGWKLSGVTSVQDSIVVFVIAALLLTIGLWIGEEFTKLNRRWKNIVGCAGTQIIGIGLLLTIAYVLKHQEVTLHRANVSFRGVTQDDETLFIWCENDSEYPANDQACYGGMSVVDLEAGEISREEQEKSFAQFLEYLQANTPTAQHKTLEPHERRASRIVKSVAPLIPFNLYHDLKSGQATTLFHGVIVWTDDGGPHRKEFCTWKVPSLDPRFSVLNRYCDGHNKLIF
jgi:hypothetical protein